MRGDTEMKYDFNVPPFVGNELEYITDAVRKHKICGDGEYTKRCNKWIEERTGTAKALLTTSCTHATEMAVIFSRAMRLLCRHIHLYRRQMLSI